MIKKEARKEIAKVVFDLAKYLLTAIAVSSIFSEKLRIISAIVASSLALGLLILGYNIMPEDKKEG